MATQKEVKNRINSVKNIRKITRAMEMVAAARLRRAEQRIDAMRPYAQSLRKATRQVAAASTQSANRVSLLQQRENVKRVGVILVTGDRGLAGSFNTQIIRAGLNLKKRDRRRGRGGRLLRRRPPRRLDAALPRRADRPSPSSASPIARRSPTRARSGRR